MVIKRRNSPLHYRKECQDFFGWGPPFCIWSPFPRPQPAASVYKGLCHILVFFSLKLKQKIDKLEMQFLFER